MYRQLARVVLALLVGSAPAAAGTFDIVADFGLPAGREPHGGVVEAQDGCLYGTTVAGGAGHGTVYRLCSTVSTTIVIFDGATTGRYPQAGLMLGSDGQLYGTNRQGGPSSAGTIYRVNPADGRLTTLHVFNGSNGAEPLAELIEGRDGRLYGVTSLGGSANKGTAFAIQKSGAGFAMLKSFTGANGRGPGGRLVEAIDGNFYGTTANGGATDQGTVFRLSPTGTLTTVLSFSGTNGANPYGGLVDGEDGFLYGLTGAGGANYQGTAYRLRLDGSHTVLRSFAGADGSFPYAELILGSDGVFYGTTMFGGGGLGVIFKMTAAGGVTVLRALTLTDGGRPDGALFEAANGRLYGTAPNNGPAGAAGTVYEVTRTGGFARLHAFSGAPSTPYGALLPHSDGSLYGVSSAGGAMASGTIFKLVPGVSIDVLYSFDGSKSGSAAYDGLMAGSDGSFYGTAVKGGASGVGTIYKITPAGAFTVLASASTSNANGFYPQASLAQTGSGVFYGVMSSGGSGGGTIFKMTAAGAVTVAHAFSKATQGATPYGRLLKANDGLLYGTTSGGGSFYMGSLFSYDPAADRFTLLYTFTGTEGSNPFSSLVQGNDGRLYGTTFAGGRYGYGTVFAFDLATRRITTLHSFTGASGAHPYAGVIEATDGRLYGTTSAGGAYGLGTVYAIDKTGTGQTVMHSFRGSDGSAPRGALAQAADFRLYGATPTGGSTNSGVIFSVDLLDPPTLAPPAAPSNLTATAASATRVDLAWTPHSTNEQQFQIERCEGSACANFAQVGTAPAGRSTYADTTVAAGTTYRYRVRAANDAGESGYTNVAAATTPSSSVTLKVTVPNNAAKWAVGSTQRIKWSHNRGKGATVQIQVTRDGGATWAEIAGSVASNGATSGFYDWVVTAPATSQARIRVAFTDAAATDTSDVNFTIGTPFIRVTSPNVSTATLTSGTTGMIKWNSNLGTLERVKIELSLDGGATYPVVMLASTPADGSQGIAILPAWVTATAKVRVSWLQTPSVADQSDQSFSIR